MQIALIEAIILVVITRDKEGEWTLVLLLTCWVANGETVRV